VDLRTKYVAGGAIAAVALVVISYLASPVFAAGALRSALQSGDRDRLEQMIDFPAVKEGLKQDLNAALIEKLGSDPEMKDNPFAGLGVAFVPMIVDRMVDAMVTPAGLAKIARSNDTAAQQGGRVAKGAKAQLHYAYVGLDRFRVTDTTPGGDSAALVMERRGWFQWKLVRIQLPSSVLASEPTATPPPATPGPTTTPTEFPPAVAEQASPPLPNQGECWTVRVSEVGARLQGDPDSGSSIGYENGKSQVSYDLVPGIAHSQVGDSVRLCVVSLPQGCPAGDNRGIVYGATNLRTNESWQEPDSEHMCGGA
jgi:hypothetical protein